MNTRSRRIGRFGRLEKRKSYQCLRRKTCLQFRRRSGNFISVPGLELFDQQLNALLGFNGITVGRVANEHCWETWVHSSAGVKANDLPKRIAQASGNGKETVRRFHNYDFLINKLAEVVYYCLK